MNLVIDIGNTFAKTAVFKQNKLLKAIHFRRNNLVPFEEFLRDVKPSYCAFSSVADNIVADNIEDIERLLESLNCNVLRITGQTPVPFKNLYRTPETLGSDRLAAVAGAYTLFPNTNVLVIDAGTCITYDFIDAEGNYRGGNISPGPTMRFQMLHDHTARLPLVDEEGEEDDEVDDFGKDTITAIRNGVMNGVSSEIGSYINDFQYEYEEPKIVFTGGKMNDIKLPYDVWKDAIHEPHLVEIGLNTILLYNLFTPNIK